MRRYAIGVQLWLLVCCGVATGYLWRAALERGSTIRYVTAGEAYEPTTIAQPRFEHAPVVQRRTSRPGRSAGSRHEVRLQVRGEQHVRITRLASAAVAPRVGTAPPAPRPPAPSSKPRRRSAHRTPSPAPHAAPAPPAAPPAPPPPPPAPPPAALPPAAPSPVPTIATDKTTRPGWGHGDRNHNHTGPPGQASSGHGHGKK